MATKFITVSVEIMHDKNLTPNQKFILAEIQQLISLEKGCIASNKHFSELVGITTQGVSKAINQLEYMGYIIINNAQTKRNFGRVITINSGKSGINSGKSGINSGLESKENTTKNKTINIDYVNFPLVNAKSCNEWLEFKKYKTQAPITKTLNFLSKYSKEVQQQIIDTSIMNNYKGLFEPKSKTQYTQNKSLHQRNTEFMDSYFRNKDNSDAIIAEVG